MEISINSLCLSIITVLIGILCVLQGWRMSTQTHAMNFPMDKVSLWILEFTTKGFSKSKPDIDLLSPQRIKFFGIYTLVIGVMAVLLGGFGLFVWFTLLK